MQVVNPDQKMAFTAWQYNPWWYSSMPGMCNPAASHILLQKTATFPSDGGSASSFITIISIISIITISNADSPSSSASAYSDGGSASSPIHIVIAPPSAFLSTLPSYLFQYFPSPSFIPRRSKILMSPPSLWSPWSSPTTSPPWPGPRNSLWQP